jgi:hypothetical protein
MRSIHQNCIKLTVWLRIISLRLSYKMIIYQRDGGRKYNVPGLMRPTGHTLQIENTYTGKSTRVCIYVYTRISLFVYSFSGHFFVILGLKIIKREKNTNA